MFEESKKPALKGVATQHIIKASKSLTFEPKTFFVADKKPLNNSSHRQRSELF